MRQATPDLLAQPAPAPTYDLAAAMTAAPLVDLYFDYAALGTAGAAIRDHAIAIKLADRRMAEATVDAGLHLLAVKASMPHGSWLPWLADEFGMSDDAAERMMNVARRFGSNSATLRNFSPSVLALLAAKSVPDSAVDAAIAAAEVSPVTVTAARAIIAAHRPARCRKCGRTLTDPDAIRAGIGACCAARLVQGAAAGEAKEEAQALPEWVTAEPEPERMVLVIDAQSLSPLMRPAAIADSAPAPTVAPPLHDSGANGETHADPHTAALVALAARLEQWVAEWRDVAEVYGEKTGDHLTPLAVKHGIERMQATVQANMPNGGWD